MSRSWKLFHSKEEKEEEVEKKLKSKTNLNVYTKNREIE